MGLFDRIFGNKSTDLASAPPVCFGRYSDAYKDQRQYDAWDRALDLFEKKAYLDSYVAFFEYLRDEGENNVHWEVKDEQITFAILQGSKKIEGVATPEKIKAEAKIAHAQQLNMGFMHQLVNRNFSLEYSRFALDPDDNITIVFDSFTLDGSPYKLYFALRELAINADKQDDLLLDEFAELEAIQTSHLVDLPQLEKEVKYKFIRTKIESILGTIDNSQRRMDQYPGGVAYLLLDLCYRLDFLTKPEGFMMEMLERMNRQYFGQENNNTAQKNQVLRKDLEALLDRSREDFYKEMYQVHTTFGITKPIEFERVQSLIKGELPNMNWYQDNGYEAIAIAIPGYIVGNCLFNYAVPKPIRDFFKIYYRVTESNYFQQLGFKPVLYQPKENTFNRKAIRQQLREVGRVHRDNFPNLEADSTILKYNSLADFCRSFLEMIAALNMKRKA